MKTMMTVLMTLTASAAFASGAATTATTSAPTTAEKAAPAAAAAANTAAANLLTVEGPIAKVVAAKKEIYVQGADKKHEFYFNAKTELTQGGKPADFSVLKEGTKVRVSYVLVGKRMEPAKVEILQ